MKFSLVVLGCLTFILFANRCLAQESEFVSLHPEQPCWLEFSHDGVSINDDGTRVEVAAKTTIRFLRTIEIENEEHWWMEIEFSFPANERLTVTSIHRLLVLSSALRFGKDPLQHVRKVFYHHSQMTARDPMELNPSTGWVKPWFTRALIRLDYEPEFKELADSSLTIGERKYECRVWRNNEQPLEGVEGDKRVEHTFFVADEKDLPLSLVSWTTKTPTLETPGDFEFSFVLTDFGNDPTPAIPLDDD